MTRETSPTETSATPRLRCQHLLSKGLFVNDGLPHAERVCGDGNFWCGVTLTIYGPDERICDIEPCRDASRSCYEHP